MSDPIDTATAPERPDDAIAADGGAPDAAGPAETRGRGLRLVLLAAPLLLFAALAAVFGGLMLDGRDSNELPSALIGRPAPEFDLPALPRLRGTDGAAVPALASTDLAGEKPFLVNIFASWCAPCRAEHPILMDIARRGAVDVVGINYKDEPENALRFLGALGNPYTRVGIDPKGRAAIDWGFYGIPESFLVDRQGRVVHKVVGPLTPDRLDDLNAAIARLAAP